MAWSDRIRQAAYTSPGGVRVEFQYEDVAFEVDKKTAAFEFPDEGGTYVQDLGHTGRRFPLRLFFSGAEYDTLADAFIMALTEKGAGKLEHPMYGLVLVVPFGAIKRADNLKTAANQAVIEVTFWETTGLEYPRGQSDLVGQIEKSASSFVEKAGENLKSVTEITTVEKAVKFTEKFKAALNSVRAVLAPVVETQAAVLDEFNTVYTSINNSVSLLIGDLATLGTQTAIFVQIPAQIEGAIGSQITHFTDTVGIFTSLIPSDRNALAAADLYAQSAVSGYALSLASAEFKSKPEALEAAEALIDTFAEVVEWRDLYYDSLGVVDTGEAYQDLQSLVYLTAGYLVELSFSLAQEYRFVLDRKRSIIDLAGELYGTVDSMLDFFISSNNFTGSEIIELPIGREIVYYR